MSNFLITNSKKGGHGCMRQAKALTKSNICDSKEARINEKFVRLHLLQLGKNPPGVGKIIVHVCIFFITLAVAGFVLIIFSTNNPSTNSPARANPEGAPAATLGIPESTEITNTTLNKIFSVISVAKTAPKAESATPLLPISSVVFSGKNGDGWESDSWGIEYEKKSGEETRADFVSVTYNSPWSGLSYFSSGFFTSGHSGLLLEVNLQNERRKDLYVSLYDALGKIKTVPLSNYVDLENHLPNSWYKIYIPLSDFSNEPKTITHLTIESATSETVFFGDIKFVRESVPLSENVISTKNESSSSGAFAAPNTGSETAKNTTANLPMDDAESPSTLLMGWSFYTNEAEATSVGALRVIFHKSWSSIGFRIRSGFDISEADTISFSLSDDEYSNARLYIIAYDVSGKKLGSVLLNDYIYNKKVPVHTYANVLIPMKKLGATGNTIGGISIESENPTGVLLINSITFIRLAEATTGTVPPSQIYRKGFRNGWVFDTTNTIANPASTERSGTSDYSIELIFTQPWSSFSIIHPTGFETKNHTAVSLMVYGGDMGWHDLYLISYDTNGAKLGTQNISTLAPGGYIQPNTWSAIEVPLSLLNAVNIPIGNLEIESAYVTERLWIDEIKFIPER
jgi:hypothetical protein